MNQQEDFIINLNQLTKHFQHSCNIISPGQSKQQLIVRDAENCFKQFENMHISSHDSTNHEIEIIHKFDSAKEKDKREKRIKNILNNVFKKRRDIEKKRQHKRHLERLSNETMKPLLHVLGISSFVGVIKSGSVETKVKFHVTKRTTHTPFFKQFQTSNLKLLTSGKHDPSADPCDKRRDEKVAGLLTSSVDAPNDIRYQCEQCKDFSACEKCIAEKQVYHCNGAHTFKKTRKEVDLDMIPEAFSNLKIVVDEDP